MWLERHLKSVEKGETFNQMMLGQLDHSLEKDQTEALPLKTRISSKWIRDTNVRNKITQVLSKPWENSLINLELGWGRGGTSKSRRNNKMLEFDEKF